MAIFQKLTPFFGRYSGVFTVDYWPASNKIQAVVNLIEGDGEDSKLHLFTLNCPPAPRETTQKERIFCQRCILQHPVGDGAVSYIPSVSCPCRRPPCATDPCHTLKPLRKTLLIRQLSHPSGCCLRLLSRLLSSATGYDTSLTAVSCCVGKVAQRWGIDLRKGKVAGLFTYLIIFNFDFSLSSSCYILTHVEGAAATTCSRFNPD